MDKETTVCHGQPCFYSRLASFTEALWGRKSTNFNWEIPPYSCDWEPGMLTYSDYCHSPPSLPSGRLIIDTIIKWEERTRSAGTPVCQRAAPRCRWSMPGDSETKPGDQAENESHTRQPFLIGVAGGTASGKVGISINSYLLGSFDCLCGPAQMAWYDLFWDIWRWRAIFFFLLLEKDVCLSRPIMFLLDQAHWLCCLIRNELV